MNWTVISINEPLVAGQPLGVLPVPARWLCGYVNGTASGSNTEFVYIGDTELNTLATLTFADPNLTCSISKRVMWCKMEMFIRVTVQLKESDPNWGSWVNVFKTQASGSYGGAGSGVASTLELTWDYPKGLPVTTPALFGTQLTTESYMSQGLMVLRKKSRLLTTHLSIQLMLPLWLAAG